MALIPLQLPPGVLRNGTDFESSNRWRDASLVRWNDGSLRPVGGWKVREQSTSFTVAAGGQSTFTVTYFVGYIEVYLNSVLVASDDYVATNGTTVVLDTAATVGQKVEVKSLRSLAEPPRASLSWVANDSTSNFVAATYNKLYYLSESMSVTDITPGGCSDTAYTTKTACEAVSETWTEALSVGEKDAVINNSYGGGYWGIGNYGQDRPNSNVYQEATTWSLDNWGEYLLACSVDDGKIYEWTGNTSVLPTPLSGAPVDNKSMLVTEERFVFALGAGGNPRKIQWCDREDNTAWTPSATNEAGDFELQTSGQIMCGIRMRGRTIILTDSDAHIATYQGPPFVYGFERVGTACGVVARKALIAVDEGAFWMGAKGFFVFDGSVAKELKCDVLDYIFSDVNYNQISKVYAVHNSQHGEVWWFYPSDGSLENDSYISFDYKEGHWNTGRISRTCGIDRGTFDVPLWIDANGVVYDHETGTSHTPHIPFAESGPISIGNGDQVMKVTNLIPDELVKGNVNVTFKTRFYPNATETVHGPYSLSSHTHENVPIRFTGRQVRIRIEGKHLSSWRAGIMRIEARPGGKR